jgi:hypothetical protein
LWGEKILGLRGEMNGAGTRLVGAKCLQAGALAETFAPRLFVSSLNFLQRAGCTKPSVP